MIHPMFAAARCFVPLHPQLPTTIPSPWPCRRAAVPTAVSAKPRRRGSRGPRRDRSWDDDGSGSDSDVDDGFFGQEPDDDEPEQEEAPPPGGAPSPAPAEGQLRGSDVLLALQRAAAAKEARKSKKNKPAARQGQGKEKLKGGGEAETAGEVRPVVIRPEWAARIRELELRVQQLADKYYHHQ